MKLGEINNEFDVWNTKNKTKTHGFMFHIQIKMTVTCRALKYRLEFKKNTSHFKSFWFAFKKIVRYLSRIDSYNQIIESKIELEI